MFQQHMSSQLACPSPPELNFWLSVRSMYLGSIMSETRMNEIVNFVYFSSFFYKEEYYFVLAIRE